jgi:hypothetical protein
VINRTCPLEENDETRFSALLISSFSRGLGQMFVDVNEYKYATSASTVLSIVISETSYCVLNVKRPITDKDEPILRICFSQSYVSRSLVWVFLSSNLLLFQSSNRPSFTVVRELRLRNHLRIMSAYRKY